MGERTGGSGPGEVQGEFDLSDLDAAQQLKEEAVRQQRVGALSDEDATRNLEAIAGIRGDLGIGTDREAASREAASRQAEASRAELDRPEIRVWLERARREEASGGELERDDNEDAA